MLVKNPLIAETHFAIEKKKDSYIYLFHFCKTQLADLKETIAQVSFVQELTGDAVARM